MGGDGGDGGDLSSGWGFYTSAILFTCTCFLLLLKRRYDGDGMGLCADGRVHGNQKAMGKQQETGYKTNGKEVQLLLTVI